MKALFDLPFVLRELQSVLYEPLCQKYNFSLTEILILNALAEDHQKNTATHIVKKLRLTKSHISTSIHDLIDRGYLIAQHEGNDHRSIPLHLCDSALSVIEESNTIREKYIALLQNDFSAEEMKIFCEQLYRLMNNAAVYLETAATQKKSKLE